MRHRIYGTCVGRATAFWHWEKQPTYEGGSAVLWQWRTHVQDVFNCSLTVINTTHVRGLFNCLWQLQAQPTYEGSSVVSILPVVVSRNVKASDDCTTLYPKFYSNNNKLDWFIHQQQQSIIWVWFIDWESADWKAASAVSERTQRLSLVTVYQFPLRFMILMTRHQSWMRDSLSAV